MERDSEQRHDDGLIPDSELAVEVHTIEVDEEISSSFMAYALSVITSRAIPDIRDGLKPVQRRLLYAAHDTRLLPTGPTRKSAKLVGETMGRFHPHGDSAIYETMVRMAQPFSLRTPLFDSQGNFGSLDDPPAASRYTECRMSHAALDMVDELSEATVDFSPTYDDSELEPVVLPARLPNLLVNGVTGIAVGMATSIAPHHPAEVARAASAVLADPDISVADIMKLLPGPDFPCGGVIVDSGGIAEAYTTGRGLIKVRAKVSIERVSARRDGIVITELPYGIGPERLIAKVKELVTARSIDSISDIADHSDRHHGLRVVVEVKSGHDPKRVLATLYAKTPLEDTFAFNHVVLDNGSPRTAGIRDLLQGWIDHRYDVVQRRTRFRLDKAIARAHIVEGLVKAMDALDEVIATIRSSKEVSTARTKLMKLLGVDEVQADHILETTLRRLTSLEVTKLKAELKELRSRIADLTDILDTPARQQAIIAGELDDIATRYDQPRRSEFAAPDAISPVDADSDIGEDAAPGEPCVIVVDHHGKLSRRSSGAAKKLRAADLVRITQRATSTSTVRFVTDSGRLLRCNAADLPPADGAGIDACTASEVIDIEPGEQIVAMLDADALDAGQPAVVVTAAGVLKRCAANQVDARQPAPIIGLRDGDRVVAAFCAPDDTDVAIVTSNARILRTPLGAVNPQGRSAAGVAGMRVTDGASVIAAGPVSDMTLVVTLSDAGLVKVCPAVEFPSKGRGGAGVAERRLRRSEAALTGALVTDGGFSGVGSKGGPVALPEPGGRNDTGSPTPAAVVSLSRVVDTPADAPS